jgi:hypothetical protein
MKMWKPWIAVLLMTPLASGCALAQSLLPKVEVPVSNYCSMHDIELYYEETRVWLLANDADLLRQIVANNQTHERVCP